MSALTEIQFPVSWLVCPLLIAVILWDLRLMRLPNALVGLFVIVAVVSVPMAEPLPEVLWRVAAALVVFAIGLGLFALRLMGGGDVKLMTALILLIPTHGLTIFALLFSVGIFAGVLGLMALRRATDPTATSWLSLKDRNRFPLGLSIGLSGLAFVAFGDTLTGMLGA